MIDTSAAELDKLRKRFIHRSQHLADECVCRLTPKNSVSSQDSGHAQEIFRPKDQQSEYAAYVYEYVVAAGEQTYFPVYAHNTTYN